MQEIIKCKDCKWWEMQYVKHILVKGECKNKDKLGKNLNSSSDDDDLNYENLIDANPFITIKTGANFGCVHGELREDKIDDN